MAGQIPCELYGYFGTDRVHLRLAFPDGMSRALAYIFNWIFLSKALAEFLRVTPISHPWPLKCGNTDLLWCREHHREGVSGMWVTFSKNSCSGTKRTQSDSATAHSWPSYLLSDASVRIHCFISYRPLSRLFLWTCKTEMHSSEKLSLAQNYLHVMDDSFSGQDPPGISQI